MSAARERIVFGIALAATSFAILAAADALTKLLSSGYSIFEVAVVDGAFATLLVAAGVWRAEGFGALRMHRPWLVLGRSVLAATSLVSAWISFSQIPLADAYAIAFVAPLAVTALSAPALGERVDWRQWAAVIAGFAAVFVMLRPGFGTFNMGQLYILISALLFAVSILILRRIAGRESSGAMLGSYFLLVFLIGLPAALPVWRWPAASDLALMLLAGLCTALGNYLLIRATRYAPAAIVSSFLYTQLIWGTIFGMALFGDWPDAVTIAGAAIIVASGLYTLRHAAARARTAVAS